MDSKRIGERIKAARAAKGMTQDALGEKLGVSFQAVSSWETGKYLPDCDHLPALSRVLDLSVDALLDEDDRKWELGPVNYDCGHMFTFVKGRAQMLGLSQTLSVLGMLRDAHGGQERRSRHGFATSYMVHPLTMACHALAMGIREDDVLAAALAHDMAEDANIPPEALPVGVRVQQAVRLLSKNLADQSKPDWEARYYENIRQDPLACMVKCLDRINNLAGMADAFSRRKMIRYAEETDRYYPALLAELKKIPAWNNAWWLMRYQMMTMLEAFKRIL